MAEIRYENVLLEGVAGTFVLNEYDFLFSAEDEVFKWSLSNWIRSEKSKKTPKVRLTFKEPPIKLSSESSQLDALLKPVVVADFVDSRDKLDEFCNFVAQASNRSRTLARNEQVSQLTPSPKRERSEEEPATSPRQADEEVDNTKRVLLSSSKELATLYNTLVSASSDYQGFISSSDFWEHHKLELSSNVSQPLARSNLEGFVSAPPASTVVNSQNVFNYSQELADALLTEDETIRNLHSKLVLGKKLPEDNFWKRILQSRYFYNLIGEKVPENQILYEDIKGEPIRRTRRKLDANDVLRSSDLSSELITVDDGKKTLRSNKYLRIRNSFGAGIQGDDTNELLVQRFNLHSLNIIRDSQKRTFNFTKDLALTESPTLESQAETYRKRKLLDSTQEDLQDKDEDGVNSVCVINTLTMPGQPDEPAQALVKSESLSKIKFKLRQSSSFADNSRWVEDLREFDATKYIGESRSDDLVSRRMFVLNTKLCQSEKLMQLGQFEYDPNTVNHMREVQKEIIEVLQMYYKTLMPEEAKRSKLLAVLRSIKQKIESLNDAGISSHTAKALQPSLLDQITAVEAYDMKLRSYVSSLRSQRAK